ncbi:hypothetical protein DITRI_Ditri11bG0024800 [Diplodiscus trichospermus]
MASSSSSSSPQKKYHVFLSFRGEDTRHNFTSHLLEALKDSGIQVFFDDTELKMGEEISPALLEAIIASKISVVVFSKDYASSRSCLSELSQIMDCKRTKGQIVLPIFYHVNPSDVRNHGGSFKKSFNEHLISRPDKTKKWKAAFTEVGELKGQHITGHYSDKYEAEYIKAIVKDVLQKLNSKSPSGCEDQLVGIDDQK